jgi:hypothetical protein
MDSSPPATGTSSSSAGQPQKHHAPLRWVYAILGLFLVILALVLVLVLPEGSNRQFTWMTSEQITQAMTPGPLTILSYRVQRMLGPLMRYYHSTRPNIVITSEFVTASPDEAGEFGLGAPAATNANGLCVWILSSKQMASFSKALKTRSVISILRIQTADGTQAAISMGLGNPNPMPTLRLSRGQSTPAAPSVGRTGIDILPKISADGVNLLLSAISAEADPQTTPGSAGIRTNFFAACRVLVPDAGGLVLDCGDSGGGSETNYWLIVSPVLVDARGMPIKP